ncbi:hypothetical protein ACFUGD_01410 [Streptomyces sp. NPDC057217]|uniref:hypothetical protein n=1 Tax=Streptomyces sp. NPDC057217 TaxID=3346054 RepID=UPI003633F6EF
MSVPAANQLLAANVSGIETDATGWTAGTNTTRARSTARFYQGAASLSLTATAAGSVSVTTAVRVPVTAGTEYQAYAYVALAVAAAGRASAVSIEWYAASTGGSPLSTSTGVSTAIPNSTAWVTPSTQVTAVAPVGATYATLTITVTGMSAGAVVHADTMALGVPNIWPGNLLSYNTAGLETDASGWTAEPDTTITRTTADSWEGWCALQVTTSGSGSATRGAALTTGIPVTPGSEYTMWVMAKASATSTASLAIRWYTSGGTLISTSTSETWSLTAGTWDRVTGVATAPPTAATAKLVLVVPLAAVTTIFDQMGFLPSQVASGSLLTFAEQSHELLALAWSATSGCTVSRSTTQAFDGLASLRVAATTTGTATIAMTRSVPVTPRQSYRLAPHIWHALAAFSPEVDLVYTWLDAGDAVISAGHSRWTLGTPAGWYTPVRSALAPDGAAKVRIEIRFRNVTPSDVYYVDATTFGPGGLAVYAEPTTGYGVDIKIQGLTDGAYSHWSIWRVLEDGTQEPVRGPDGDLTMTSIVGDLATAQDYEAPLGVPVRYAVRLSAGGVYRTTSSLWITLDEPPTTDVVIKDPGQPAKQCTITVSELPQWTRSARQAVHQVRGRARPVVISDVRVSRTGTLALVTATAEERDALWWVLEEGATLLVQWPSVWGERDVYVQVGDVSEQRIVRFGEFGDRTWSLALTEVDRPIGGMAGSAGRTWTVVSTESDDWTEVLSTYGSWLDVYTGVA